MSVQEPEAMGHPDLDRMTLRELRKAQAICQAQIPMAFEQGNTRALAKLQEWDLAYADAIYRRCFT